MSASNQTIRAGIIPLLDCAPLVIAHELGFASGEGVELVLVRETSWATIRDRLAVGHLDAAHLLAPMPIAAVLGLNPMPHDLVVPVALGSGGNTVTVSHAVWRAIAAAGAPADFDAARAVAALEKVVASRKKRGEPRLVFGIVHPHSAHHYELNYWLAAGGIIPGRDVELVVVPPPLMPAALASGRIDGFCAGEPWGSAAVGDGAGVILTTKAHIWRSAPEKVIGVSRQWLEHNEGEAQALVRAIYKAARWCDAEENQAALAEILARPPYLGLPRDLLQRSLSRRLPSPAGEEVAVPGLLRFAENNGTVPWPHHGLWFYTQMVRWGQIAFDPGHVEIVRRAWRPEIYRAALAALEASGADKDAGVMPVADATGAGLVIDLFFDGGRFDPDRIAEYIAQSASPLDLPVAHRGE
ncbi:MAG: ABC transporter substrate-binding protein [Hyphomicrobiaceae bacterium]|nr:ABC transporter substrate-binding protein [Hyphomicrobiaceae bacterium]